MTNLAWSEQRKRTPLGQQRRFPSQPNEPPGGRIWSEPSILEERLLSGTTMALLDDAPGRKSVIERMVLIGPLPAPKRSQRAIRF